MPLWRRILLGTLAIAVAILACVLLLAFCVYEMAGNFCGNDIIQKLPAPDGRHVAFLFQRDCGATTGFSSQISLFPKDAAHLPNDSGNLFVASQDKGDGPLGPWHGPLVRMRWIDSKLLEVRYNHAAQTFAREEKLGAVRIRYLVD